MNIIYVSNAWIEYRKAYRLMKKEPLVPTYQYLTAKAYANLLMIQALYWADVRPL